jgi:hypothetical protein
MKCGHTERMLDDSSSDDFSLGKSRFMLTDRLPEKKRTVPEAHAVIALAPPIWEAIRVQNSPE